MVDNNVPQDPPPWARCGRRREPRDAKFEIVITDGPEGEMLARRQPGVLWDEMAGITRELAHPNSAEHDTYREVTRR